MWHSFVPGEWGGGGGIPHSSGGIQQQVLLFLLHPSGTLVLLLTELNCSRETRKESSKMLSCVGHNAQL